MENMELLQAMRQMMEEVVSPIYERMDKMQEELSSVKEEVASVKEEVASVKALATKTQLTIENDISPKIKLLFEGQMSLQNRFAQLDEMERILREVMF